MGEREVSDYPEEEVEKIALMYQYVSEGYSPSSASTKAEEDLKGQSFVYKSPFSFDEERTKHPERKSEDHKGELSDRGTRTIQLVADVLSDTKITKDQRVRMEELIHSFVMWLRETALKEVKRLPESQEECR